MKALRLAIATHAAGAGAATPTGDVLLGAALESRGHAVEQVAWTDPCVAWEAYDAVVVRSTWDYHLRPREFRAWLGRLEAVETPTVNPAPLLRWNHDKRYLRALQAAGVSIPETVWLGEGERAEVGALRAARGWAAAVVKPTVSASAHGTVLAWSGEVLGPMMVQALVPEIRTRGEWSLVFLGGAYSHAVVKRPAAGDFRVQREHGGTFERAVPPGALVAFARSALGRAAEPPALARVDAVETGRGPVLMELEVIEPELFLGPEEAARAAEAVLAWIRSSSEGPGP